MSDKIAIFMSAAPVLHWVSSSIAKQTCPGKGTLHPDGMPCPKRKIVIQLIKTAAIRYARCCRAWHRCLQKGGAPVETPYCKLEIFLPENFLEPLRQALQSVDAGHIGRYDSCLSYSPVTSFWRPLEGTAPYLGQPGKVSREPEIKVEVTCRREQLEETLAAVRAVHP